MGTFIAVTFGVMMGILLAGVVTVVVMFNPTIMTWLVNKYMGTLEKSMKNFEEKMDV